MNTETYAGFRLSFLHSDNKKDFLNDCLFLNLYDFWQLRRNGFLLKTYKTKNSLLKRIIRRKVKGNNELPTYKILLRQIMVGEEQFNPTDYLNSDQEDYGKNCVKKTASAFERRQTPSKHLYL